VSGFCWEPHPDGPFATLITVAATYCSPDAYDGAYEDLISRARAPDPDDGPRVRLMICDAAASVVAAGCGRRWDRERWARQ
jgi:hypothetical protein